MKFFYKVTGHVEESGKHSFYLLGYTSSKSAWLKNSNGWKPEQLIFIKQQVKPSNKQAFLNR